MSTIQEFRGAIQNYREQLERIRSDLQSCRQRADDPETEAGIQERLSSLNQEKDQIYNELLSLKQEIAKYASERGVTYEKDMEAYEILKKQTQMRFGAKEASKTAVNANRLALVAKQDAEDANELMSAIDELVYGAAASAMPRRNGSSTLKEDSVSNQTMGKDTEHLDEMPYREIAEATTVEVNSFSRDVVIPCEPCEDCEGFFKGMREDSDNDIDIFQPMRSLVEQNVSGFVLPKKSGEWKDKDHPGNGAFHLYDDAVIKYNQKSSGKQISITGKQLKEYVLRTFGTDCVYYKNNEPDFSPFEDPVLGHIVLDDISAKRVGSDGTYTQAMDVVLEKLNANEKLTGKHWTKKDLTQYMKEHNLTWHECGDCKTIRAVPTVVNAVFKHTGGISLKRGRIAIASVIYKKYGGQLIAARESMIGSANGLADAILSIRESFKSERKARKY